MIYASDIKADKVFKSLLEGRVYEDNDNTVPVRIYSYGEKPMSVSHDAFIIIQNNGSISGYLSSMDDARSKLLVSVYTKAYNGVVDELKETHIFRQIEDILMKEGIKDGYAFERDFRNIVIDTNNLVSGYHTKGINVNWNLI